MTIYDDGRPKAVLETGNILVNEAVAPEVWFMRFVAPECAKSAQPGQFIHIRLPENLSGILRLPFSIYGVDDKAGAVEILYQVVGGGTRFMTTLTTDDAIDCMGPIGHGWRIPEEPVRALAVTGGLGAATIPMLAAALRHQGSAIDFCMGAPTSKRLVGRDRLAEYGQVSVATDDGTEGLHGFSTDLMEQMLEAADYDIVYTCGPEPMQRIVARKCIQRGIACDVNLERLMACGLGACLSCVVDTIDGKRRACVDGPVFDAKEVSW